MANKDEVWVNQIHYVYDHKVRDESEARELAESLLREKSFKFMRAEGCGEGNHKLAPGAIVTVKYVGKAYSGDYIAYAVVHKFSLDEGYTTKFYLKRNMADDEFMKGARPSGMRPGAQQGTASGIAADTQADRYGDEDEDGPEFRKLIWKKDGKEISEALVDDEVSLYCEVKNIADGEKVKFSIFEQGASKDDPVEEVTGTVSDGKVEAPWKVVYKCEEGSSVAEELEEQGYTIPDYCFVAQYNGVESAEQSKELILQNVIRKQLVDDKTGETLPNMEYTITLTDDSVISGTTDNDGYIEKIRLKHFAKIAEIEIGGENE
jgi:hypothetical protein